MCADAPIHRRNVVAAAIAAATPLFQWQLSQLQPSTSSGKAESINSLLAAISAVVYNSATNSYDYAKVKAITVVGTLSRYDWEMLIGSRFTNLTYLDVSRTTGLSTTSYDGYDRGYTLTTLLLPATVSTIGYNTFNNFTALRSITCYAATPPKVESNGFAGVPTDAAVYVPAESLPLYMEADVWKNFDLQPITQGVHKLTVNIPAAQGKTLKDMFLELTNTQTSRICSLS